MTLRATLLSATALLLSAGAAAAMPAVTESDLNMRSGPGTEYGVVAVIPGGARVDAIGCDGGWCQVAYGGTEGYASRNYLQMAGAAPNVGVVVGGPTVYPYDYYDDGYDSGPSFGFYTSPVYGYRHHRQGGDHAGNWRGGGNGPNHAGNRHGGNPGNWQGGNRGNPGNTAANRAAGFAGPPASWQRPGTGIGPRGNAGQGASVGPRTGRAPMGGHGGATRAGADAQGGGNGFAGSIVRGGK